MKKVIRFIYILYMCVCVVVPLECARSSLRIPVSVKRAKTRRENMIVSASSSVNGDAIYTRPLCVDCKRF